MEFMEIIEVIILGIGGIIIGAVAGFLIRNRMMEDKVREGREQAERIIKDAEREAETKRKEIEIEAKDKLYQARIDIERETKEKQTELLNLDKKLSQKESHLDKKGDQLDRKDKELAVREKTATEKIEQYEQLLRTAREQLEHISGMSAEDAKKQLMQAMEDEAKFEAAKEIKHIEDEAKNTAEKKAKEIITTAIQRYANEHIAEVAVSVVNLPNDEMKGRIIGREGRM